MEKNTSGNRGKLLEDMVENAFSQAMIFDCTLFLLRQNSKWIPHYKSKRAIPVKSKGAPIDFLGVIDGTPIAIECKEYSTGMRLNIGKGRFPDHEINALNKFETAGGKGFVVSAFWETNVLAIYPFSLVYDAWLFFQRKAGLGSISYTTDGVTLMKINFINQLPEICRILSKHDGKGEVKFPFSNVQYNTSVTLFDANLLKP